MHEHCRTNAKIHNSRHTGFWKSLNTWSTTDVKMKVMLYSLLRIFTPKVLTFFLVLQRNMYCGHSLELPQWHNLTFTALRANSADKHTDDIFVIFTENKLWHFMQIVSRRQFACNDKAYFLGKIREKYSRMSSTESFIQLGKIREKYSRMSSTESFIQHAKC